MGCYDGKMKVLGLNDKCAEIASRGCLNGDAGRIE